MIACSNCGQMNDDASFVCRFCGLNLRPVRPPVQQADYVPPPPYAWATDQPPAPPVHAAGYPAPAGYRCPRCSSTYPPLAMSKISSDGWLVFALLLFFCAPLFWIGLLMKEEYRVCPVCRATIS